RIITPGWRRERKLPAPSFICRAGFFHIYPKRRGTLSPRPRFPAGWARMTILRPCLKSASISPPMGGHPEPAVLRPETPPINPSEFPTPNSQLPTPELRPSPGEARARRYDGPSGRRGILLSLTQADGRPMAWAELLRAVGAGANCPRSTVLGPRPPSSVFRLPSSGEERQVHGVHEWEFGKGFQ